MIENRFIALILLVILIAGTALFLLYNSPLGTVLVLAGVIGYFIFNKRG
ncbi:MAG: hypothetical protein JSV39_04890 [Candidatus Aenigmatarchaeota archaeon]|nr:MAG: hypothetical protein JSV39_04890 [Candidatus Aenigmarchaeota archaeon]